MKKYILFDLDGTLTDPKEGITTCVQYALKELGIEEPDLDKLEPFIGPPLKESFMQFYQMTEAQALRAVEKYRERFENIGIFENKLYEGIPEMLRTLQSKGMYLAVASSKPTVFVKRILEHFKLDKYFRVVVGSELDGTRTNKDEVVEEALRQLFGDKPIQHDQVYMVGDRRFDVEGAKALRVESVGVSYGYGSLEELKEAKADYIVRSVEELQSFLLRGTEEKGRQKSPFQRIWLILFPFLMFILVRQLVMQVLNLVLLNIGSTFTGVIGDFLIIKDEADRFIGFTGNAGTLMVTLGYIGGAFAIWRTTKMVLIKAKADMKLTHLKEEPVSSYVLLVTATLGGALGLNLLMELSGLTNKSEAYRAVAADQYSAYFLLGLICYGIVTPVAEEILFRGMVFNVMKRTMKLKLAVLASAMLFAVYHMNMVQGVYAFLMGLLMAYAYEYFGTFAMPVLIHALSNTLSYTLTYTSLSTTGFVSWPVCVFFLTIGFGSVIVMNRNKRIF